jgi:hypothetical protein
MWAARSYALGCTHGMTVGALSGFARSGREERGVCVAVGRTTREPLVETVLSTTHGHRDLI